jgi:hypothetical protein
VRDVGRDGLVARFVRAYAERQGRPGLLSDPARLPELATTIGREALLVMAAEVRRLLPQAFVRGPKGVLRPDDAAFVETFYSEFLASLMRDLDWPSGDASAETQMFRRDLEMYRRWDHRAAPAASAGRAGESPFRDRCALLLDPAMMEQARRGAADFEREILRAAAQRFRQLGRPQDFSVKAPRHSRVKVPRRRRPKAPRRKAKRKQARRPAKPAPRRKTPARRKKSSPARRRKPRRG